MSGLEETLRQAVADLTGAGARFALVGGLAVSVRTEPRFTRDADLAVAVSSDSEAEQIIHRLRMLGYRVESLVEQDAVGRLAAARLTRAHDARGPVIDLLFASSGIEPELVRDATPLEVLAGLTLPVAQVGDLIALKALSRDDERRPQDLVDLRALIKVASTADVARARASTLLIAARGFDRGRDLPSELDRMLRPAAGQ